jgi:hypothetical protein
VKISVTGQHVVGGLDSVIHIDKAIPPALNGVRAGGWAWYTEDFAMGPGQWPEVVVGSRVTVAIGQHRHGGGAGASTY